MAENGYAAIDRLLKCHDEHFEPLVHKILIEILQVSAASAALFTAFSIGTALAPNLASFFVFRILTAFQGTAFLIIGSAVIGDIYKPVSHTFNTMFIYGT
jgi:MFS family permease